MLSPIFKPPRPTRTFFTLFFAHTFHTTQVSTTAFVHLIQFNIFSCGDSKKRTCSRNERMAKDRTKPIHKEWYDMRLQAINFIAILNICYNEIWKIRRNQERCNLLIHVARCRMYDRIAHTTRFYSLHLLHNNSTFNSSHSLFHSVCTFAFAIRPSQSTCEKAKQAEKMEREIER